MAGKMNADLETVLCTYYDCFNWFSKLACLSAYTLGLVTWSFYKCALHVSVTHGDFHLAEPVLMFSDWLCD